MNLGSKIVAIGDIHGEYDKLTRLMYKLNDIVDFSETTFVFLGDYIDGGPHSKYVVEALISFQKLYPHWQFLYGNHEWLMEEALLHRGNEQKYYLWWNQGGRETGESYMGKSLSPFDRAIANVRDFIPQEHLDWIDLLRLSFKTNSFFFVHAGVRPGVALEDQGWYDMIWIRDEFITSDYNWGKRIVFGHTVQPDCKPLVRPNKIGLDTMYHGYGHITAAVLDEEDPDAIPVFVTSE